MPGNQGPDSYSTVNDFHSNATTRSRKTRPMMCGCGCRLSVGSLVYASQRVSMCGISFSSQTLCTCRADLGDEGPKMPATPVCRRQSFLDASNWSPYFTCTACASSW
uniref:Uncharacterized protein n=1 Tax=Anopheles melas TaxID=34690 RepID=A0A182UAR9_9DIPT